jgi:hypothetical protein
VAPLWPLEQEAQFEIFWYSHHFFVGFFVFNLIHGEACWRLWGFRSPLQSGGGATAAAAKIAGELTAVGRRWLVGP